MKNKTKKKMSKADKEYYALQACWVAAIVGFSLLFATSVGQLIMLLLIG